MPDKKICFLDWNLPLLPAVVQKLLAGAKETFIDLSDALVIVPTVQSGRRLREALALESQGLFPPEIVTPDGLLEQAIADQEIANEAIVIAAWVSVLRSLDYAQYTTLFPVEPEQTIAWQHSMARRFVKLRNELGEEGLDFQQVAQLNAKTGYEPERWQELAKLEKLYLIHLKKHGFQDSKQIRREAAHTYCAPAHIKRIIMAATPDPQPLVLQALELASQQVPFEIWIYGSEDAQFDDWGRPILEYWNQRPLDFEKWNVHLQSVNTPKAAAEFIVESMQTKAPESVLLGLADASLNPIVVDALNRSNIANYDPEGQPLNDGAVGQLTELLCRLRNDQSTPTIRTLLQHPDIQDWLNTKHSANQLLIQLDRIYENHLAPNLSTLMHFAERSSDTDKLNNALNQLNQLTAELNSTDKFAATLAKMLQKIYAEKEVETSTESGIPWKERADAICNKLQQIAEAENEFPKLPKEFAHSALAHNLHNSRVYPTRPKQAHDLLGWLELLWNDAPHLIVVGLNEHSVPESIAGDAFLPEKLREELGLRTNAQRFVRDAYLLEALCRRRARENGRIDFLAPQVSHENHPLKPSRLLFQGSAETLIRRSQQLFRADSPAFTHHKHNSAWRLKPPPGLELPTSFSVSALRNYLQCPFRFFLRHILNMRPLDVETRELSPAAFGTLFHDTVAKLKGNTFDHATKSTDLVKKLHAIAEQLFKQRYGNRLSFALRLQHEALMARIVAFAELQIADLAQNGSLQILNTEEAFEISLAGFILSGRIDRIDKHESHMELIDYKTGNQPANPESTHLALVGNKAPPEHLPEEAFIEQNGKRYRWTDLQLPLYKIAKDQSSKTLSLAYFNLGQNVDKSGIARWDNFTREHLDSAEKCATAILKQIKAGIFWPPNQNVHETYDDFAPLFPDGIENSVDADAFSNYRFKAGGA